MDEEVADFLHYCRIERRLADLTCAAYERDVKACVRFLNEHGIDELRLVRPPDLRRFLAAEAERRPAVGSQARQARAGPAPARAVRVRGPAPQRAARARLERRRSGTAADPRAPRQGRTAARRPDPPRARTALRRLPPHSCWGFRAGAVRRRAGQAALADDHGADVPPLREHLALIDGFAGPGRARSAWSRPIATTTGNE